ncbi:uncharacterized protein LOC128350479 [Hemicordylus capensis]|uniref:uncharacterized protein LOC128350479 n=1 Tax=Hemicordylus capensis TaxID=884348 RepID=UPI00230322E9|nr:uncharacterized protein LOC128350479 [Hemicordylus capensis]
MSEARLCQCLAGANRRKLFLPLEKTTQPPERSRLFLPASGSGSSNCRQAGDREGRSLCAGGVPPEQGRAGERGFGEAGRRTSTRGDGVRRLPAPPRHLLSAACSTGGARRDRKRRESTCNSPRSKREAELSPAEKREREGDRQSPGLAREWSPAAEKRRGSFSASLHLSDSCCTPAWSHANTTMEYVTAARASMAFSSVCIGTPAGLPAARWMDSITKAVSAPLRDLKGQVEDRSSWRESIYVVAKRQNRLDGT